MQHLFRLIVHELLGIWREPRFWLPMLVPAMALLGSGIVLKAQGFAGYWGYGTVLSLGLLAGSMAHPLTADSFAGERERNTLELLLLLPVKFSTLFLAKLGAVLPFSLFFSWVITVLFYWSQSGDDLPNLVLTLIYSTSAIFMLMCISLWLSARAASVRSAGQSGVLLLLVLLFFTQWAPESWWHSSTRIIGFSILFFALGALSMYSGYRKLSRL
jgi:ABC-type Na+ efflux pump permease subunit